MGITAERPIPGKGFSPWIIVVVLAIFVFGGLGFYFISQQGEKTTPSQPGASGTTTLKGAGLTLRASFSGPSQIKVEWEGIEITGGVLPTVKGELVNTSPSTIKFEDIKVILRDGKGNTLAQETLFAVTRLFSREIGPGDSLSFTEQLYYADPEAVRSLELRMVGAKVVGSGSIVQPTATALPATPPPQVKGGSWTKTFQTEDGPIPVKYTETPSAKGKVAVWAEIKDDKLYFNIQNISDRAIEGDWYVVNKNAKGHDIGRKLPYEIRLNPGQVEKDQVGGFARGETFEARFEVK